LRRHLLYLTNSQLTARVWQGGRLLDEQCFSNDEAGWEALPRYLAQNKHVPILLLVDLIEEDFHRDTIPHIVGQARSRMVERRLQQLYRDTPFRHAARQGREKEGRKDDRMLFAALTNVSLLNCWIDIILKEKVPLEGIYSVALFSSALFAKLQLGSAPTLLITHQSGGLRQSYFVDGYLRFSRLTQLPSQSPAEVAEVAKLEMSKTRQFLANTRLLQRGQLIEIVVLDNPDALDALQTCNLDLNSVSYRFLDFNEAKRLLALRMEEDIAVCDLLFLTLLARKPPTGHFALFEQTRSYMLWQVRIALYVLSSAAVAASVLMTGVNIVDALEARAQVREYEHSTQEHQARYEKVLKSMPATMAKPHDMKTAVDLEQMIAQNSPSPTALLFAISHALDTLPQLHLTELNWEVSEKESLVTTPENTQVPATTATTSATAAVMGAPPPPVALIGVPKKPLQIIIIKGQVQQLKDGFRTALEDVNQFSAEMMKDKRLQVTITHPPLDVRPSVVLNGQAGNPDAIVNADFEIRLVLNPDHGR
jgi:hypothetical protein